MDEILATLDAEMRLVQRELANVDREERVLAERRAALEARRDRARDAVTRMRDRLWRWDDEIRDVEQQRTSFTNAPDRRRPLWELVQEMLGELRGRRLTAEEIVDELAGRNFRIKSPNAREMVRTALKRHPDVFVYHDGKFALVEAKTPMDVARPGARLIDFSDDPVLGIGKEG